MRQASEAQRDRRGVPVGQRSQHAAGGDRRARRLRDVHGRVAGGEVRRALQICAREARARRREAKRRWAFGRGTTAVPAAVPAAVPVPAAAAAAAAVLRPPANASAAAAVRAIRRPPFYGRLLEGAGWRTDPRRRLWVDGLVTDAVAVAGTDVSALHAPTSTSAATSWTPINLCPHKHHLECTSQPNSNS